MAHIRANKSAFVGWRWVALPCGPVEQILLIPLLAVDVWHHPGWPRHRHRLGPGPPRPQCQGAVSSDATRLVVVSVDRGMREMLCHARPTPIAVLIDVGLGFEIRFRETRLAPRISRRTGPLPTRRLGAWKPNRSRRPRPERTSVCKHKFRTNCTSNGLRVVRGLVFGVRTKRIASGIPATCTASFA